MSAPGPAQLCTFPDHVDMTMLASRALQNNVRCARPAYRYHSCVEGVQRAMLMPNYCRPSDRISRSSPNSPTQAVWKRAIGHNDATGVNRNEPCAAIAPVTPQWTRILIPSVWSTLSIHHDCDGQNDRMFHFHVGIAQQGSSKQPAFPGCMKFAAHTTDLQFTAAHYLHLHLHLHHPIVA